MLQEYADECGQGDLREFVVRFPWGDKETKLSGMVKWIKPLIGKPGRFRLGMRFHNPFWELDMLARQGKL